MTTVQIPDEIVRQLMLLTGKATPEAAVMVAIEWWLKEHGHEDCLRERAAKAPKVDPAPESPQPA
ncbi:hypothetical protein [Deinococcus marmoris]|uniref:Uncharacterized protein n=1 Tax=Deinococcus marmoris TaxID=249408 RepID=A0A1U7NS35_9DEIO|nr:hypothetical protein [Deinococcus marmoris]OLV15732.1 hypothetical protein BOO71_0013816 [Deinococcus marmoris]